MDGRKIDEVALRIAGINPGVVRTAGTIEFKKDTGPVRRDIRVDGFEWSQDALKNLTKILWAAQRSHSYATAALRLFSKMPSSQFSPDGLLGGRGYIQSVKEMRNDLGQAVEVLSSFTDTIYDEVNADHWSSVDAPADLLQDTEHVKENPEEFVEQQYEEEEGESGFTSTNPDDLNPSPEDFGEASEDESSEDEGEGDGFFQTSSNTPSIDLPNATWGDEEVLESILESIRNDEEQGEASGLPSGAGEQDQSLTLPEMVMHTNLAGFDKAFSSLIKKTASKTAGGSSSIPVETLPGPRVEHIGPGESGWGTNDDAGPTPSDDPTLEGFVQTSPIYENGFSDGVTGYDNPTDGDASVLVVSARIAMEHYSWLPGSSNEKNLGYYERGLSEADVQWLRDHSAPDDPMKPGPEKAPNSSWLWGHELWHLQCPQKMLPISPLTHSVLVLMTLKVQIQVMGKIRI